MLVSIRDESARGESLRELTLELLTERVTVRDLIRERVHHTVRERERRGESRVAWEAEFKKACQAFLTNGFFVLIGDRQVESLDEAFVVGPETRVTFLQLVPLIGG